jgi:hypothetical protein
MLRIELHQMFRSNGLIDDFVIYGAPDDYEFFSEQVRVAASSTGAVVLNTNSPIRIEISKDSESAELFTSLQNESAEYFSMKEWNDRSILTQIFHLSHCQMETDCASC